MRSRNSVRPWFSSPLKKNEHNIAIAEEKGLHVELLSDPGNRVAASYGLRDSMHGDFKSL